MDKSKQPGITVNGIILAESIFKRAANIIQPTPINININVSNNIDQTKLRLVTEVKVQLNNEGDPIFGTFVFIGVFSTIDGGNMELPQFAETNAAAYIFPYIREEIHDRSIKAGLPPIILQPINLVALLNTQLQSQSIN